MQVTLNLKNQQSTYLAAKSFCLLTAQLEMKWIITSGATNHITPHLSLFKSFTPISKAYIITMSNGKQVQVKHAGTINLNATIILQDVLHVLEFRFNLLSASKLAKQLFSSIVFTSTSYYIQDPLKNIQLDLGKEIGGLYLVNLAPTTIKSTLQFHSFKSYFSISELWHCRLGHPSPQHMTHIQSLP